VSQVLVGMYTYTGWNVFKASGAFDAVSQRIGETSAYFTPLLQSPNIILVSSCRFCSRMRAIWISARLRFRVSLGMTWDGRR